MKNNRIGDNPALAAILKTVKANTNKAIEKEYKTTKLQPKEKKKESIREEVKIDRLKFLLEDRIVRLEKVINMHKIELEHALEARAIHKSIEKEIKENKYSRWKQL
jgi:poly-D-alanine transfer protein DltD